MPNALLSYLDYLPTPFSLTTARSKAGSALLVFYASAGPVPTFE
ncbi:conserved hypothetical protein (plasmid) [Borreliella burgdorferi Bol26]|uniref:Uncharacterized protein n=1 Tax=Borreliella burgdorferi (strain ZS7) TaxID=445985 RepID=A0A0H3C2G3_BORBZ|nr:conserved hypothetical protein [Borreliella burgdorferi ZS7]ACN24441.1 conserved hypothetical protein [Borreliella burgdorferi 64b]ACO37838.1 conserved hypothetical protein [Borreliella burgdorferi Bol26]